MTFKMHIIGDHMYAQHISFIYLFTHGILLFIYLRGIPTEYSITRTSFLFTKVKKLKLNYNFLN